MRPDETDNIPTENWIAKVPLLSQGLLSPHEGRQILDAAPGTMSIESAEILHRALRSMAVALIARGAPPWQLSEWAHVLKSLLASTQRSFPTTAEKIVSLRCMLLEAAEIGETAESQLPERPGVAELLALLERAGKPMAFREIASGIGTDDHAAANRLGIAVAAGLVSIDYEDWRRIHFIHRPVTDGTASTDT